MREGNLLHQLVKISKKYLQGAKSRIFIRLHEKIGFSYLILSNIARLWIGKTVFRIRFYLRNLNPVPDPIQKLGRRKKIH